MSETVDLLKDAARHADKALGYANETPEWAQTYATIALAEAVIALVERLDMLTNKTALRVDLLE